MRLSTLSHLNLPYLLHILSTLAISILTLRLGAGILAWQSANRLERPVYSVVRRLPIAAPSTTSLVFGPKRQIEVRKYEPYLIAETTIEESSMRKAGSVGFGRCAGYIFGKNQPRRPKTNNSSMAEESEKMAMTAPVRTVGEPPSSKSNGGEKMAMTSPVRSSGDMGGGKGNGGKTKISFVIGSKYNLQNVPRPIDPSVQIREVKGHYLAATSFSGPPPNDERIRKERDLLENSLEKEGIKILNNGRKGGHQGGGETLVYGYHDPIITPNFLRKNEVAVMVDGATVDNKQ